MKKIVLARIDDRLIHGQVVTAWVKQTNTNKIVIVDDPLTQDTFMQRILKAAAPQDICIHIMKVGEAIDFLSEAPEVGERIMILAKIPNIMEELIIGGVELERLILGGMGAKEGRKHFNKNISASPEEIESLKRIINGGIDVFYQLVPSEKAVNVKKML